MASKQPSARPVPAHNGGQPYKHYNADTNRFETRTPVVMQKQQQSQQSQPVQRQQQSASSGPSNSQSKSQAGAGSNRKAPGTSQQKSGGGLIEYIDKMLQTGMGGGSSRPAGGASGPAVSRGPSAFPTPLPNDLRGPQGEPGQKELEEALNSGLSWEHIAAGAAGAAAALIAQRALGGMNKTNNVSGDPWSDQPNSGVGQGPKTITRPSVPVQQPQDILTRNGLIEGQPSNNPDIDAQFYEIFGIEPPVRSGMEPRLLPPNENGLGPGNSRPTYNAPYQDSSIPGPSQRTKQLGDMDSPTYRENFGYNDLDRRAQEIINRMETYGNYNIDNFMDPASEPAVAARGGALLRGMM